MKVGIHKHIYGRNIDFLKKYEEILILNKIDCVWLDINDPNFWDQVRTVDLFIYRWTHYDNDRMLAHTILPVVEKDLKINVFPDQNTCWHYDDKIRQYYLLKSYSFPFTECWIFWDKYKAKEWLESAEFPIVFKLSHGAGSSNVVKIEDNKNAEKVINTLFGKGVQSGQLPFKNSTKTIDFTFNKYLTSLARKLLNFIKENDISVFWQREKNYVLFQKYLPNNNYDTRITVIGDRAFGFIRMTRKDDFRASGSGKIDYDPQKIDKRCVKIAFEVSKKLGFQSMAYDFLFNKTNEPEICEISYTFQDIAVYNCEGYWDSEMNWNDGHFWPQFCQLSDLLNIDNLIKPQ